MRLVIACSMLLSLTPAFSCTPAYPTWESAEATPPVWQPCDPIGLVAALDLSSATREHGAPLLVSAETVYACACATPGTLAGDTEQRQLGGDTEQRALGGDTERRALGGDTEQRALGGDTEQRALGGDTERRALGGDTEQRALGGDTEQRQLGGDTEQRALGGDTEQRALGGDTEQRALGGDTEQRALGGDTERRRLGGDTVTVQCARSPSCTGYLFTGASGPVRGFDGAMLRDAQGSCLP
jgi:hypothetical protein